MDASHATITKETTLSRPFLIDSSYTRYSFHYMSIKLTLVRRRHTINLHIIEKLVIPCFPLTSFLVKTVPALHMVISGRHFSMIRKPCGSWFNIKNTLSRYRYSFYRQDDKTRWPGNHLTFETDFSLLGRSVCILKIIPGCWKLIPDYSCKVI